MEVFKVLFQNVGIDIAKNSFVVCLSFLIDREAVVQKKGAFKNTLDGFVDFLAWVRKHAHPTAELFFTVEATGVYHEKLAFYLYEQGQKISVVLATQAKKYKESFSQTSKTDNLDAESLASMGVSRKLKLWEPSSLYYQELRELTREREALKKEQTKLNNQLHALNHANFSLERRVKRLKQRLSIVKNHVKEVDKDIQQHLTSNKEIKEKVEKVLTIPGVHYTVTATILAETDGFAKIENIRQLISYAALSINHKQSGNVEMPGKMKKLGNKHIKRVIFFPAYSSRRYSEEISGFYDRVVENRNGTAGALAVGRKLLTLIYALWKNNTVYDLNYNKKGATSCPS